MSIRGILFLTTNRGEALDHAVRSRVMLRLDYPDLDLATRAAIWRDIRVVIVSAGRVRHFPIGGVGGIDLATPKRAFHRVDKFVARRHERHGRRTRRQLRDVELAPVITVRQRNLGENRLPPGARRRRRGEERRDGEQGAGDAPHAWPASASSRDCRR